MWGGETLKFVTDLAPEEQHEVMRTRSDVRMCNITFPSGVYETRSNAQCPKCKCPMLIAGYYHKEENKERAEGNQIVTRFQCNECGSFVVPVKIS